MLCKDWNSLTDKTDVYKYLLSTLGGYGVVCRLLGIIILQSPAELGMCIMLMDITVLL